MTDNLVEKKRRVVVDLFAMFLHACVDIFKLVINSIEMVIIYIVDKLKKVITVRDLAFLSIGFGLASFTAWNVYLWYAHHSVKTSFMIIDKIVYKLIPGGQ